MQYFGNRHPLLWLIREMSIKESKVATRASGASFAAIRVPQSKVYSSSVTFHIVFSLKVNTNLEIRIFIKEINLECVSLIFLFWQVFSACNGLFFVNVCGSHYETSETLHY